MPMFFPHCQGSNGCGYLERKNCAKTGFGKPNICYRKCACDRQYYFSKQYQAGCVSKTVKTTVTAHQLIASHSQFSLHSPIHMENSQALPYAQINDRNGVYPNFAMLMQKMMIDHDSDRWIFGQPTFGRSPVLSGWKQSETSAVVVDTKHLIRLVVVALKLSQKQQVVSKLGTPNSLWSIR